MTAVPAATTLLVRDDPFDVLMVKRHHQIDFAAGALVFPGGKTHIGDHDAGWTEHLAPGAPEDAEQVALRIAALREAYEETGILVATCDDGSPFAGSETAASSRTTVEKNAGAFLQLVADLKLKLDLSALQVFARWITPEFMPKRFDTWFFIVRAPADQLALCDGREAVDAEWIAPAEAIRMADAGERTIIFPTRMNLQLLAEAKDAADALARAKARPLVTVLPKAVGEGDNRRLTIPADAGYGDVSIPMERMMR